MLCRPQHHQSKKKIPQKCSRSETHHWPRTKTLTLDQVPLPPTWPRKINSIPLLPHLRRKVRDLLPSGGSHPDTTPNKRLRGPRHDHRRLRPRRGRRQQQGKSKRTRLIVGVQVRDSVGARHGHRQQQEMRTQTRLMGEVRVKGSAGALRK
jgi:hypothetical protein